MSELYLDHATGDENCRTCPGWAWYPAHCRCGGLVHAEWLTGSEDEDPTYDRFDERCDQCGENYKITRFKDSP